MDSVSMTGAAPLEEAEGERFVKKIYRDMFDGHAPLDEFLAVLADDELEMRFPEETVHGHDGFRRWYERIINTFFDEVHTIKELEVSTEGDRAKINVLVNWQAHTWKRPAPKSQWLGFDAGQTWFVER